MKHDIAHCDKPTRLREAILQMKVDDQVVNLQYIYLSLKIQTLPITSLKSIHASSKY
jgi:hypothetical protein